MARYGRWDKFLTGERLKIYKRNLAIDGTITVILVVAMFFLDSLLPILLVFAIMFIYRLAKKQTVWQLRRQELMLGQKEALDILKGLNVRVEHGK